MVVSVGLMEQMDEVVTDRFNLGMTCAECSRELSITFVISPPRYCHKVSTRFQSLSYIR
jgi:hypothetical protein